MGSTRFVEEVRLVSGENTNTCGSEMRGERAVADHHNEKGDEEISWEGAVVPLLVKFIEYEYCVKLVGCEHKCHCESVNRKLPEIWQPRFMCQIKGFIHFYEDWSEMPFKS